MWRYHPIYDRLETPGAERYRATATDDGSLACIQRCEKGGYWEDHVDITGIASVRGLFAFQLERIRPGCRELLDRLVKAGAVARGETLEF